MFTRICLFLNPFCTCPVNIANIKYYLKVVRKMETRMKYSRKHVDDSRSNTRGSLFEELEKISSCIEHCHNAYSYNPIKESGTYVLAGPKNVALIEANRIIYPMSAPEIVVHIRITPSGELPKELSDLLRNLRFEKEN